MTAPPQPDPLLTPGEVAALFRVDPKTVTRWARSGKLRAVRTLGGHHRFRRSDVATAIAQAQAQAQLVDRPGEGEGL